MIDWDQTLNGPLLDTFGETFRVQSVSGGSFRIQGIFDVPTLPVDAGGLVPILSTNPTLFVRLRDYRKQTPQEGDLITRTATGKRYVVNQVDLDATGGSATLQLFDYGGEQ